MHYQSSSFFIALLTLVATPIVATDAHQVFKRATPTTCTTSAVAPSPTRYVCGQEGSIRRPSVIATSTAQTQTRCRDLCLAKQPECISFSYGPRKSCILYDKKILDSGFQRKATGSLFWNKRCYKATCGLCPSGLEVCGPECVDTASDPLNCNTCGNKCGEGSTCTSGACTCPPGSAFCSTEPSTPCIDLTTTSDCGSCSNACGDGALCKQGQCACPTGSAFCSDSPSVNCVDLTTTSNCGGCGNVCGDGSSCSDGSCVCPANTSFCPSNNTTSPCVDLTTSSNCGSCGKMCPTDATCNDGQCTCPGGQSPCSGACVSINNDSDNCGSCGNKCGTGASCSSGSCTCSSGSALCSGSNGPCQDVTSDANNCGVCGNKCGTGASCVNKVCTCPSGSALCAGPNGVCTDTTDNDVNCGSCGNNCQSQGKYCYQSQCLDYPSQVVINPSFETNDGQLFTSSVPPWNGLGFSRNPFAVGENMCGSQACGYDGNTFVYIDGDTPGGNVNLTQILHGVKTSRSYTFSAYVGRRDGGLPDSPRTSQITVFLDNQVVVPTQLTCSTNSACSLKSSSGYGYRQVTGNITPTNRSPVLTIQINLPVPSDAHPQYTLLDLITLTLT